jgi:O-antigen ligase
LNANITARAGGPAPRVAPTPPLVLQPANPFHRIGILLVVLTLFATLSRIFEWGLSGYKIPALLLASTFGCLILSGRLLRPLTTPTGILVVGFFVWLVVILPFSTWRSNSLTIVSGLLQSVLLCAAVAGLPASIKHLRWVCYSLGLASLAAAALSFLFGTMHSGRLALALGSLADPNEYAITVLAGLPFLIIAGIRRKGITAVLVAGACLVILNVFLRTGSRGGLIAMGALLVVLFFSQSNPRKVALAVAAVIILPVTFLLLPDYIRLRYTTFFTVDTEQVSDEETFTRLAGADIGSTAGRLRLLTDSLRMTARHPITGVGPGNFPGRYFEESKLEGKRVGWHVTHNSYTQVSSETGILGAFLFIGILVSSFRNVHRLANNQSVPEELRQMARAVRLTMTAVYVGAAFLSIGYWLFIYVLAGLSVSIRSIAEQSIIASVQARRA